MRYWLQYWRNRTVLDVDATAGSRSGSPLNHTAGKSLLRRGVSHGDVIYVATNLDGVLVLLGSMSVDEVVDQATAERRVGEGPLWEATDHVLAGSATDWAHRTLTSAETRGLRALDARGAEVPLMFERDGKLSRQTLRGLRELTQQSAEHLDAVMKTPRRTILRHGQTAPGDLLDLDLDYQADEGAAVERKHLARERDRMLRQRKIEQVARSGYAIACETCGFDFEATYGARGAAFIEVHHRRPLHDSGPVRTRLQDLALLCSNCHRIVHRQRPWLTVDALQRLVDEHRSLPSDQTRV